LAVAALRDDRFRGRFIELSGAAQRPIMIG
jgi:hypothetical protein